jgi:hypothetical protein
MLNNTESISSLKQLCCDIEISIVVDLNEDLRFGPVVDCSSIRVML